MIRIYRKFHKGNVAAKRTNRKKKVENKQYTCKSTKTYKEMHYSQDGWGTNPTQREKKIRQVAQVAGKKTHTYITQFKLGITAAILRAKKKHIKHWSVWLW